MSESQQHINLISLALKQSYFLIAPEHHHFICADLSNTANLPPQTLEGYRPDVFFSSDTLLVIGEAKTSRDIETRHSLKQYRSYLKKCSVFSGQSYIVMAVPWTDTALIHNLLKRVAKEYSFCGAFKIIVVDEFRGVCR